MPSFATEFPVVPLPNRGAFVAQVYSWLRGTEYSTVLDKPGDSDLGADTAHLHSENGEELRLRELTLDHSFEAIGVRHDFPDGEGRLWRTEAVLRRGTVEGQDLIRLRTECIARKHGAKLESPRKPYLIKMLLHDGWGGKDGHFSVSDEPLWLNTDALGLDLARAITLGHSSRFLPVIYISATGNYRWVSSRAQIEKLAFDLGGVAHVVVEPSRSFSFLLRDQTNGENVYGGAFGIALPGRGIMRRFYLGLRILDVEELLMNVRQIAVGIRSQMPAEGWDWTELQEQALRRQRQRDRNRLSVAEIERLYLEEMTNLRDRIKQLEAQIEANIRDEVADPDESLLPPLLANKIGPELFPGEFSDRLRLAARECTSRADQIGLDLRSRLVLDAVSENLPPSPGLTELKDALRRATKDSKRVAAELTRVLVRHGYQEKSDNKHIRLEAKGEYVGLDTITLPKTPSDARGLNNLRKQIEHTLGIAKLIK